VTDFKTAKIPAGIVQAENTSGDSSGTVQIAEQSSINSFKSFAY
jgi:hypothetical protein